MSDQSETGFTLDQLVQLQIADGESIQELSTTTAIHESAVFPAKMRVRKRILNNHGTE